MTRKVRHGARGVRKVSTGCSTCKKRHKKCDEVKPACSNCLGAGWKCDFASVPVSTVISRHVQPTSISRLAYPAAKPLLDGERQHMEYFHVVCADEFALCFELPAWKDIILQATIAELALHHAALAVGALTKSRYYPDTWQARPAVIYAIQQYSRAVHELHRRLDGSLQTLELAILTTVVFSYIEFLLGLDSKVEMHVQAGCAMLESLHAKNEKGTSMSTIDGMNGRVGNLSTRHSLLASAMFQLNAQVNGIVAFRSDWDRC